MTPPGRHLSRSSLAVVSDPLPRTAPKPSVWFCSHCGSRPRDDAPAARVCDSCGFGILLQSSADAAPPDGGAFIVLDDTLSICAVSREAESLLATKEPDAVNRHVTELVVPADAEAEGANNLAVAVTWAARGDEDTHTVTVRPANIFGVRLKARIAGCGPPRAALLVFDH